MARRTGIRKQRERVAEASGAQIDLQTRLRIAKAVGINVHGYPHGMNWVQAVFEDSPALNTVVARLYELEERYALQVGKVHLGLASRSESSEVVLSAIRATRDDLQSLEKQASNPEMRYAANTACKYLDRILMN